MMQVYFGHYERLCFQQPGTPADDKYPTEDGLIFDGFNTPTPMPHLNREEKHAEQACIERLWI